MTSATRLHPDFGARKAREIDGETYVNGAVVVELARLSGTPEGRAFYRAYTAAWRKSEGQPLARGERELRCIQVAMSAIGKAVTFVPVKS